VTVWLKLRPVLAGVCVSCEVRTEAEETVEHCTYSTACNILYNAVLAGVDTVLFIRIKKRPMKVTLD
jgi:hypothetical protein